MLGQLVEPMADFFVRMMSEGKTIPSSYIEKYPEDFKKAMLRVPITGAQAKELEASSIAGQQYGSGWVEPWDLSLPDYVVKTQPSEGGIWDWLGKLTTAVKELVPIALTTWQAVETGQLVSDLERRKAELALDQAKTMQEQKVFTVERIIEKVPWVTIAAVGAVGLGVYLIVKK